ncbi:DUF6867 family protein [Rhizobium sp. R693]|uniref:DUF6867 family protein n=1 Tax=Rhizobium sp. R693 TaxID=1764276 RepID=UPI000B52C1AE|nr:hypothetical protein [Rhizobium sp. R693]OWV93610.1 hypothetical protein ATY79_27110 [Rhizobium sp. R693]
MQNIFYEETSIWQFLFVTCLLGGWAAWMTGKAAARTWTSYLKLFFYILGLGVGIRFIHHALFQGSMVSIHYFIVDIIVLMILGFLGYQYTRTNQMVGQYRWLYRKTSLFSWKPKT